MADRPEYPTAERLPLVDVMHGVEVRDPYRWLEDAADPRTAAWASTQAELLAAEQADWDSRASFAARVGELLGAGTVAAVASFAQFDKAMSRAAAGTDATAETPVTYSTRTASARV